MQNKKKNKLLIFVNSYSSKMETFVYNHIKIIASDAHFNVTVLCHYYPDKSFSINDNIKVIETNISKISSRVISLFNILIGSPLLFFKLTKYGKNTFNMSVFLLAATLKKQQFDIIHAHFGQNGKLISELMDVGLLDSKLITQFHGLDMTSRKCKQEGYYAILKKKAAHIVVNTQYSLTTLKTLGFTENKITVLPVGTDGAFFKREKKIEKKKTLKIVFIGRLITLKGAQLIPDIANKMIQCGMVDFEFIIIGDGPLKNTILEKSTAINAKVKLLGHKSVDEIKSLLEECHLLIYPGIADEEGREETQGLIIQEAMFMKLPVIVSNIGGVPEAVINTETGFICKPGDIDDFANKIIDLSSDSELRIAMGEKGYALAKNKYDLEVINKKMINIYLDIIDKN